MKILFAANEDPLSPLTWSGAPAAAAAALQAQGHEVLGAPPPNWDKWLQRLEKRTLRFGFSLRFSRAISRAYASRLQSKARRVRADAIVGFVMSDVLAELPPGHLVVHVSDATFTLARNYYSVHFAKYNQVTLDAIEDSERRNFARADLIFLASDWAAASARNHLEAQAAKVVVCPLGACFPYVPAQDAADSDKLRLLWCGVDFERKGGDVAVETLERLLASGVDAHLDVVGTRSLLPEQVRQHPAITVHGFLDKSDEGQKAKLQRTFRDATILLLPSKIEAFGMVFCEAAAYGVPSVAFDTAGVSSVVVSGESGELLPITAGAGDFAEVVARIWGDKRLLSKLRRGARDRYEAVLNWDHWAEELVQNLQCLGAKR